MKAFPAFHKATAMRSWQCTTNWEGTQQSPEDIPQHRASCSLHRAGGKRKNSQSCGTSLPKLGVMEPCSPWAGRTPARPWQVVDGFLNLLHFWVQLLLYLLRCPFLSPEVLPVSSLTLPTSPAGWREGEALWD